ADKYRPAAEQCRGVTELGCHQISRRLEGMGCGIIDLNGASSAHAARKVSSRDQDSPVVEQSGCVPGPDHRHVPRGGEHPGRRIKDFGASENLVTGSKTTGDQHGPVLEQRRRVGMPSVDHIASRSEGSTSLIRNARGNADGTEEKCDQTSIHCLFSLFFLCPNRNKAILNTPAQGVGDMKVAVNPPVRPSSLQTSR